MRPSPYEDRIHRLWDEMRAADVGAMVVTPSSDLKYLCGYAVPGDERLLALVISPGQEPFVVANILYKQQLEDTPLEDLVCWRDGEDPFAMLAAEWTRRGIPTGGAAVNAAMPAMFSLRLGEALGGAPLTNGSPLVQKLRVFKDRTEMDAMIQATQRADQALGKCVELGAAWVGRTEMDFLAQLSLELTRLGVESPGACVAVGANAAEPHHRCGPTKIREGKCLLVDFGGTFANYNTDMTRTFHFGRPEPQFREVYEIVKEACLAGEAAARAGDPLENVDIAARAVIERAGYGAYFTHRTGHGIGIDNHEGPSAALGEKTLIRPGMAFSCEPGIYLPGRFGVRIEDQLLIEEDGTTHILHSFPKDLMILS